MSASEPVQLTRRGNLAVVVLDRPPVNAVDASVIDVIAGACAEIAADREVGAVVFIGAGRLFSAGADLKAIRAIVAEGGAEAAGDLVERMQAAFGFVAELPIPTIAAIRGAALGGGLELALACDLRVAADDAKIGLPEVTHGLLPGAGGTQRLTQVVGPALAARMILTGEVVDGREAAARGVVQWSVPAGDVDETAIEIAAGLAERMPAVAEIKACIAAAGTAAGFAREITATRTLYATTEVQQRLAAF
jgi:enoyl-CoA hydratase